MTEDKSITTCSDSNQGQLRHSASHQQDLKLASDEVQSTTKELKHGIAHLCGMFKSFCGTLNLIRCKFQTLLMTSAMTKLALIGIAAGVHALVFCQTQLPVACRSAIPKGCL